MTVNLQRASLLAVTATFLTALFSTAGSGADAQDHQPVAAPAQLLRQFVAEPVVQPVPETATESQDQDNDPDGSADPAPVTAASLRELVASQPTPSQLSRELNCLAGAVYFEAKGESLPGQLAVGRVIVARSKSGQFPESYCGVVFQPSQFSFVRGGAMPAIARASASWRTAVAIAQIAHAGAWNSPAEGALFFHAARVSPGWRLRRVARVDNHVFYR